MTSTRLSSNGDTDLLDVSASYARRYLPTRIRELEALAPESPDAGAAQAAYLEVLRALVEAAPEPEGKSSRADSERYGLLWQEEDRTWEEWTVRLSPAGAATRMLRSGPRLPMASPRRMRKAA